MRSLIITGALVAIAGSGALAQAPATPPDRVAPGAEMLLARTGELGLTDAQVTRLAAIARRGAARREGMRASRDSIRSRLAGQRPDSATRRQLMDRTRADLQRMREQSHADRRDAIAVLNADQQAKAWEMVSSRGQRGGRGMRGAMRREGRSMRMEPRRGGDGPRRGLAPGRGMRRPMEPRRPMPPVE